MSGQPLLHLVLDENQALCSAAFGNLKQDFFLFDLFLFLFTLLPRFVKVQSNIRAEAKHYTLTLVIEESCRI